jgi:hypothetical protein
VVTPPANEKDGDGDDEEKVDPIKTALIGTWSGSQDASTHWTLDYSYDNVTGVYSGSYSYTSSADSEEDEEINDSGTFSVSDGKIHFNRSINGHINSGSYTFNVDNKDLRINLTEGQIHLTKP